MGRCKKYQSWVSGPLQLAGSVVQCAFPKLLIMSIPSSAIKHIFFKVLNYYFKRENFPGSKTLFAFKILLQGYIFLIFLQHALSCHTNLELFTPEDPPNVTLLANMLIQAVFLCTRFFTNLSKHGDFWCSSVLVLLKSSIQSS